MYEYCNNGTCSSKIHFDIRDNKVYNISFENGCEGNLKAVAALAEGMDAAELIKKLRGICCGSRSTSCGDQFARALEKYGSRAS